ncbi:MAG: hypothetical protein ACLRZ2_05215 [Veillonella sp.]
MWRIKIHLWLLVTKTATGPAASAIGVGSQATGEILLLGNVTKLVIQIISLLVHILKH